MILFPEYTTFSRYHGDESLLVDSKKVPDKLEKAFNELLDNAKKIGGFKGWYRGILLRLGEDYYKEKIYREYCSVNFNTADYERALKMEEYFTKLKNNRQLIDPKYKKGIVYIVSFFISLAIFLLFIDNIGILDKIANNGFNKYHENFISIKMLENKNRELENKVIELTDKLDSNNIIKHNEIESFNISNNTARIALGIGIKLKNTKIAVINNNSKKTINSKQTKKSDAKKQIKKPETVKTNFSKNISIAINRYHSKIDKHIFLALIDSMSNNNINYRNGVSYGLTAMPLFVAKDIWYTIYPNDKYNPNYLYRADVNIELSVYYINNLTRALDGDIEKALAIYVGYSGDTKVLMKKIDAYLQKHTGKSLDYYNELSIKQHNMRKLE